MASPGIDGMLAGAKATLAKANKAFPSTMADAAGVKPKKEPMNVSTAEPKKEMPSLGKELGEKAKNVREYTDAVPKYHKGGKIKKDGVQEIDAKKGETILPTKNKKKVMELAMKHLDGMKDGAEAAKGHSEKKSVKHTKKHGKVKHMHVSVNDDDTFSMRHEHHPMEDGTAVPDTTHSAPDMDGLIDHLQEHMGEPNPGEAEASAPPAAAAPMPA